jgi:DNA-binding GntR family transcriptional regulator
MVIKHRTLDSYVVEELRQRIISGRLAAGERIDQQALAEELGVSRMPVREALRRLSAEGFVELISHRGAMVAKLSHAEIVELYEMRAVLQGLASRLAVPHYTDEDVDEIRRLMEKMDTSHDVDTFIELNRVFHERVESPSGAKNLLQLIERLTQQCVPSLQIAHHYLHAEEFVGAEHHAIYEACAARDPERLEAEVRRHLSAAGRIVADYVKQAAHDGHPGQPASEDKGATQA